jgi:hypothetical protein
MSIQAPTLKDQAIADPVMSASVADLTFLPVLPRVIRRNVKSKATLEPYIC